MIGTSTVRRLVRRTLDTAGPRVGDGITQIRRRSTGQADQAAGYAVPTPSFHDTNHELRTIALERVPKGAARALSVGASGRWYFDWFEAAYGPLTTHVGVEAFEAKPDDLPDYVSWICDTADKMVDVGDGSVDLVFAGQTTEHLWAHELTGFLCEAHRVLSPEGLIVLDSPNRLVTHRLHWSHGQHTIEISADEMTELLALAGFDIIDVHGIWSCLVGGRPLQLEEGIEQSAVFARRVATGWDDVDNSFVWWINGRRTEREPDRAALSARVDELFAQHWDTRVCRGIMTSEDDRSLDLRAGQSGIVAQTLPFPLYEGGWTVALDLAQGTFADLDDLHLSIWAPDNQLFHQLAWADATVSGSTASWHLHRDFLVQALELRVGVAQVRRDCSIALPLRVRPDGPPPGADAS